MFVALPRRYPRERDFLQTPNDTIAFAALYGLRLVRLFATPAAVRRSATAMHCICFSTISDPRIQSVTVLFCHVGVDGNEVFAADSKSSCCPDCDDSDFEKKRHLFSFAKLTEIDSALHKSSLRIKLPDVRCFTVECIWVSVVQILQWYCHWRVETITLSR